MQIDGVIAFILTVLGKPTYSNSIAGITKTAGSFAYALSFGRWIAPRSYFSTRGPSRSFCQSLCACRL